MMSSTKPEVCIAMTPEEDLSKKAGKDRACGSGDILAERQADKQTHTQTCSSQYFATAPANKVMIKCEVRRLQIGTWFAV